MFRRVLIVVSERCNLNCKYCYVNLSGKVISDDVISNTIEAIRNRKDLIPGFEIQLWGGEPLLDIDVCSKILDAFPLNDFFISTNGTIFNDNISKFLYKYKDRLRMQVSIDGDPAYDVNRTKQELSINNYFNIKNIVENVSVNAVVSRERIKTLYHDTMFLHEKFGSMFGQMFLDNSYSYTEDDLFEINKQIRMIIDWYVDCYKRGDKFILYLLKTGTQKQNFICSAGSTDLCYYIDGDIYPCPSMASAGLKTCSKAFVSQHVNNKPCNNCDIMAECSSSNTSCMRSNYEYSGDYFGKSNISCKLSKLVVYNSKLLNYKIKNIGM